MPSTVESSSALMLTAGSTLALSQTAEYILDNLADDRLVIDTFAMTHRVDL